MKRQYVRLIRVAYIAIIAFLVYMLLPSLFPMPSRERTRAAACLNNMRQFDSAKYSLSMVHNLTNGTVLTPAQIQELADYIAGGWEENTCPAGGEYTVGAIGQDVHCSVHGSLRDLSNRFKGE
jgi:hypothetical protein